MPRDQTGTDERVMQYDRTGDSASGEEGEETSGESKVSPRRERSVHPLRYMVPDREITPDTFDEDDKTHIGSFIAKVEGMKMMSGGVVILQLRTIKEFAHLITDASQLSRANSLLIDMYELFMPKEAFEKENIEYGD